MKVTVKTRGRRRNNHNQIGAHAPTHIFALAHEQARIEGRSASAMINELLVNYLQEQGTTLKA